MIMNNLYKQIHLINRLVELIEMRKDETLESFKSLKFPDPYKLKDYYDVDHLFYGLPSPLSDSLVLYEEDEDASVGYYHCAFVGIGHTPSILLEIPKIQNAWNDELVKVAQEYFEIWIKRDQSFTEFIEEDEIALKYHLGIFSSFSTEELIKDLLRETVVFNNSQNGILRLEAILNKYNLTLIEEIRDNG